MRACPARPTQATRRIASRSIRAQDFHRVEPYGAVRGHQAGEQRNKGQRGRDGGKRQRIRCAHPEDEPFDGARAFTGHSTLRPWSDFIRTSGTPRLHLTS